MQFGEAGPIPKPARWMVLALLFLAVVFSVGLCIWFALISPDRELAIVSLGAAQSAMTGFVVAAAVLFSFRMKETRDIQRVVDDFFIEDVLPALQGVDLQASPFVAYETPRQFRRVVPQITPLSEVSTDFCRGRDAASFILRKAGRPPFEFYLKVNVRHITIKYFFDPALFSPLDDEKEFRGQFHQTLAGAESVGYDHRLVRRYHASRGADVLELWLYLKGASDMLASPAERLFLRNDLRTMTSSMIHTLDGARAKA
jgi:hypothetical protein